MPTSSLCTGAVTFTLFAVPVFAFGQTTRSKPVIKKSLSKTAENSASLPPSWKPIPLLPPEAAQAGVFPGGEGCQWPRGPVVVAASDPNFLLLPIDVGGLYRSLDGGKHWAIATVGWDARGANGFAIDPRNARHVLGIAGNSMDYGKDWGPPPHGVYLSHNKAASWRHVLADRDGIGGAVAFDPSSFDSAKGICTVAYYLSPRHGLFRTNDGGATWLQTATGDPVLGRLDRDWTQGGTVVSLLKVNARGRVYVGGGKGLHFSIDGGKTWTRIYDGEVFGLDVGPDGSVYQSGKNGLQRSRDGGTTWQALAAKGFDRQNDKPIERVTVSPANGKYLTAWVAGDNWKWVRYVSHDGGETFVPMVINKGLSPVPQNARQGYFAWHPTDPNVCYGLGGDWVTRSTDAGRTFTWFNNGNNGVMVGGSFNFSAHAPNQVFLSFQDYNGAFTTDGGKTWNYRDVSGKGWGGQEYGGYTPDGRVLWCGDSEGWSSPRRMRISRDGGTTWAFVNGPDGKPLEWKGADVSNSDPADPQVGFASDLRSADGGKTWARMDDCEGVYTADPATAMLYGKKGNALVRSADKGMTWQTVAPVPDGIGDVAVGEAGRVYVSSEERLKVWDGKTWTALDIPADQFGNTHVTTVATDPQNRSVLYIGGPRNTYASHATVCRSTDGGKTWRNLSVTSPLTPDSLGGPQEVGAIRVHPVTREAWAAGQCFGVWKIAPPGPNETGVSAALASAPKAVAPPLVPDEPQSARVLPSTPAQTPAFTVVLRNGAMEQGDTIPTGWETKWEGTGKLIVTRDTTVKHGGSASLRVASGDGSHAKGQASQIIDAPAGTKFVVRGWLRTEGEVKVNVAVQPMNAQWTPVSFLQARYAQNNTDWAPFAQEIILPDGATRFGVVVLLDGQGKAWLDDVSIDKVDTTTAKAEYATVPPPDIQDPTVPMHGYWPDYPSAWLSFQHTLADNIKKEQPKLVFIGDSITQGWSENGKAEWNARFAPKGAFNLGVGGDRTQQLLWRIQHGTLDNIAPKAVVLLIGVNNLWRDVSQYGVDGVAAGAKKVVAAIRIKCPSAKILVLGVLPTQEKPDNLLRQTVREINARYARLADHTTVLYLDIGAKFTQSDGSLSKEIMLDFLHLSPGGYRIFADAIEPTIAEMLR